MNKKNELLKQLINTSGEWMLFNNLEECLLNARDIEDFDYLNDDSIKDIIKHYKKGDYILWNDNQIDWGNYYIAEDIQEVFDTIIKIDDTFASKLFADFYVECDGSNYELNN